jgi:hypothetical protein
MKTISQYREDIAALMKKAADMAAKATVENRDLTDGELSIKNEMMDTVEPTAGRSRPWNGSRGSPMPWKNRKPSSPLKRKGKLQRKQNGTGSLLSGPSWRRS